jgi:prepilin-type processing-associated H-X9-DG protein
MAWASPKPLGSGTQADPYFHYAGSGWDGTSYTATTTFLPMVLRPAETAIVSDAASVYGKPFNTYFIAFGCEAAGFHQGGGNFIFLDGHSRKIARNPERYLKQRASDGKWFEQYFTYDME